MTEMAQVPADWFAIFQHDTLPGHPANTLIAHPDDELDWPTFGGVPAMPMSGRFLVRDASGALTPHEDGFLVVGDDGHPRWQAEAPA